MLIIEVEKYVIHLNIVRAFILGNPNLFIIIIKLGTIPLSLQIPESRQTNKETSSAHISFVKKC